jgi:hypothetical protein
MRNCLARPPHHRPADEAVHEFPPNRAAAHRRGQGRVQHRQRLSHRARPAIAFAQESAARAASARSLGHGLGQRGGAAAQERCRLADDRHLRRDPASPSRDRGRHPSHAGAAHSHVAGAQRRRAGRHLPARAPAGPPRTVRFWAIAASASPARHSIIGCITSAWPSRVESTPMSCFAVRASWHWLRDCRTRYGRSAALPCSIAATACRPPSAISMTTRGRIRPRRYEALCAHYGMEPVNRRPSLTPDWSAPLRVDGFRRRV